MEEHKLRILILLYIFPATVSYKQVYSQPSAQHLVLTQMFRLQKRSHVQRATVFEYVYRALRNTCIKNYHIFPYFTASYFR